MWDDKFEGHGVHNTLEQLRDSLGAADEKAAERNDTEETVRRLFRLLDHIDEVLASVDPELVPFVGLDQVNQHLTNAKKNVDQFRSRGNVASLNSQANTHVEHALRELAQIRQLYTPEDLQGIREHITSYRRSAAQLTRHLETDVEEAHQQVDELNKAVDSTLTEVKDAAESRSAEIKQKLENRLQQLSEQLDKREQELQNLKQRTDQAIDRFQEQFSNAQEKRLSDHNETLQEQRQKFTELFEGAESELTTLQKDTRKEVDALLETIGEQRQKAIDMVGVIANTGLTGGFQKTANEEQGAADRWRRVAIVSLVGLVGVAVWAVVEATGAGFTWEKLAAKGLLTASIGVVATYAIRESTKHRSRERRNRRLELELQSIGPYVQELPAEKQVEIKDKLVERLFARGPDTTDDEQVTMSTSAFDLLSEAVRLLAKNR